MITVFYGDQVYGEYPDWSDLRESYTPEGAYIYDSIGKIWVVVTYKMFELVAIENVPAMCKAWMLIL